MTTEPRSAAGGPRRILVATDGSASADAAVELVDGLSWPPGTAFRVVEAIDLGPGLVGGAWPSLALAQADELESALHDAAGQDVSDAQHRLDRPDREVTGAVLHGRAASAIVGEARTWRADLIVVGSRGHGTISSMLLGSVSSEVLDHAPAPVLVARRRSLARVVLAWDGSTCAEAAAETLRTWPLFAGAEIRVVTVADTGAPWWSGFGETGAPGTMDMAAVLLEAADVARAEATRLAGEMAASLRAGGRSATAEPRDGDAATELIAAARDSDADVVVMGTHGRTGLARLALGSVATNVLRHAHCSVLVVREVREADPAAMSDEAAEFAPEISESTIDT